MKQIETKNLSKRYGHLQAVDAVSVSFNRGKIYGLLGRNGAGKTTLLRMLTRRIFPSSGAIYWDGEQKLRDPVFAEIYHVEAEHLYPEDITLAELIQATTTAYPKFDAAGALADMEEFSLKEKQKYGKLSTGNQTIVKLSLALNMHNDFLILDEPSLGADAVARDYFYRRILEVFSEEEPCIILSTHLIKEVDPLIQNLIFIDRGKIILQGSSEEIKGRYLQLSGPSGELKAKLPAESILHSYDLGGLTSVVVDRQKFTLEKADIPEQWEYSQPDLQDLFVALTGNQKGLA